MNKSNISSSNKVPLQFRFTFVKALSSGLKNKIGGTTSTEGARASHTDRYLANWLKRFPQNKSSLFLSFFYSCFSFFFLWTNRLLKRRTAYPSFPHTKESPAVRRWFFSVALRRLRRAHKSIKSTENADDNDRESRQDDDNFMLNVRDCR